MKRIKMKNFTIAYLNKQIIINNLLIHLRIKTWHNNKLLNKNNISSNSSSNRFKTKIKKSSRDNIIKFKDQVWIVTIISSNNYHLEGNNKIKLIHLRNFNNFNLKNKKHKH